MVKPVWRFEGVWVVVSIRRKTRQNLTPGFLVKTRNPGASDDITQGRENGLTRGWRVGSDREAKH